MFSARTLKLPFFNDKGNDVVNTKSLHLCIERTYFLCYRLIAIVTVIVICNYYQDTYFYGLIFLHDFYTLSVGLRIR